MSEPTAWTAPSAIMRTRQLDGVSELLNLFCEKGCLLIWSIVEAGNCYRFGNHMLFVLPRNGREMKQFILLQTPKPQTFEGSNV